MYELAKPSRHLWLVTRTSCYEGKPCEEAFEITRAYTDRRTTDDPKKVYFYHGKEDWWYGEGTNHRIENGQICRDLETKHEWAITTPDFIEFIAKYGQCVIGKSIDGFNTIEIYDEYHE